MWKPQIASIAPTVRLASKKFGDDRDDRADHMETRLYWELSPFSVAYELPIQSNLTFYLDYLVNSLISN